MIEKMQKAKKDKWFKGFAATIPADG